MNDLIDLIVEIGFTRALWVFGAAVVIHELEEWNISRFERTHFSEVTDVVNDRNARGVIAFISTAGLLWCAGAALTGSAAAAAWVLIPAIGFMTVNALQHVYWSIRFRAMAPGVITAVLLILPASFLLVSVVIKEGYAPVWYLAAWAVPVGLALMETVRQGARMMAVVRGVYGIGRRVAMLFCGQKSAG